VKRKPIAANWKPKEFLRLPDLDQAKSAVLDSLLSKESQPGGIGMLSLLSLMSLLTEIRPSLTTWPSNALVVDMTLPTSSGSPAIRRVEPARGNTGL
jgi:hypothetical protein